MGTPGKFVVKSNGKFAVGPGGKLLVYDANGECPACCGSPVTCCASGDVCCFSDQSTVTVEFANVSVDGFAGCDDWECLPAASYSVPWLECGESGAAWLLTPLPGGGDLSQIRVSHMPGAGWGVGWLPEPADSVDAWDCLPGYEEPGGDPNPSTTVDWFMPFAGTEDCCGGTYTGIVATIFNDGMGNSCTMTADVTLTVVNNKCCRCDVDATPTCIASTKDYCPDDADHECDQFTGNEAECDEALP